MNSSNRNLRSILLRPNFFLFLLLLVGFIKAEAQYKELYSYQDLSHIYYLKQKDSLQKNWTCPQLYQNKETQKKYREFWDSRTDFITSAIMNKNFVHDKEVYDYINSIIAQIVAGNKKELPIQPLLLIDRSSSVNAYAVGGNVIAVNLGLLSFADTREDIAFAIAHELSHNILNHTDNAIKEKAQWLTSDDYKQSVNAVLDSKYERYTRLKKILEGYSFNRSKHQRYHESDADSLAVVLLKNSNIAFNPAFFLKLDSADMQYKQPLLNPLKTYLAAYNLPFDEVWAQKRTRGLSTHNYSFKDTTLMADSLKTHPDCIVRYKALLSQATPNATATPVPAAIKEKATKMLIWNLFDNQNLTACLYRVMQQKDKGATDEWYDMMMYTIFSGLYYSDKQLSRFNAIGIMPKEEISKDYYALQTMLEQMPREILEQYCKELNGKSFWQSQPADARAFKSLLYTFNFGNEAEDDKSKGAVAKQFTASNTNSMYCEFADHFKK